MAYDHSPGKLMGLTKLDKSKKIEISQRDHDSYEVISSDGDDMRSTKTFDFSYKENTHIKDFCK